MIVSKGSSGTDFAPAPAGVHRAVCCDVVDLGILEVTYSGKTKRQHKVRLSWQIDEPRDDGKPYLASKRYTASLHEKAALRHDLEGWRGRAFTADEENRFDLDSVIGASCLVTIAHITREGRTYANIVSVSPLMRGMGKLAIRDYVRVQDRKDDVAPGHDTRADDEPPPFADDDIPL